MKLSEEQKQELEKIYQEFLNDPRILRMKEIPMHRGSNCYEHSFKVAKLAVRLAIKHKRLDVKSVLIAAILHDYYLYDWRKDRSKRKWHGHRHPHLAAQKAVEDFGVSDLVRKAISSHMWPINILEFPCSVEARILSFSDKIIATREAMTSKKHKAKRRQSYLEDISHLF